MDLETSYEIVRTAVFIQSRNFKRVALQFPDELLKDSTAVVGALRDKLSTIESNASNKVVRLYVMADTTYGSCCVDEVGASHINADCVIHYGHTCLSPTSNLPALFVFGKAPIIVPNCVEHLCRCALVNGKPVVVLFGLEYAHAIQDIKEEFIESSRSHGSTSQLEISFADSMCSIMSPSENFKTSNGHLESNGRLTANQGSGKAEKGKIYSIGGLSWSLPERYRIEDCLLYWVGADNAAFANVVLTFNGCEIVRYDAGENLLVTDVSPQKRIVKRRYYLVEKARDANIIGILVGTLGVAGYLHMIYQMKELLRRARKKAYMLVMGRPNPAKLANFPECDVFIYVSCAQTALLDSKEFLAPVITPFEAMLAFSRESQWTGAYLMEFQELINSAPVELKNQLQEEARFSFLKGGYVEDFDLEDSSEENEIGTLAVIKSMNKALRVRDQDPQSVIKGTARSGAEYFAARSFQGLDLQSNSSPPEPFLIGRFGKASRYEDEKSKQEKSW
ncbi:hypothetical protein NMG60_11033384 [Bertholletia excelsa]